MEREAISQTVKLGMKIRARRKELGMTQEQLAEQLGVGHQALSRIEQGHMAPKMDRLPALAKALKCTVAELFREQGPSEYAIRLEDLLSGLPEQQQTYVFQHLSCLIFLLKMDDR